MVVVSLWRWRLDAEHRGRDSRVAGCREGFEGKGRESENTGRGLLMGHGGGRDVPGGEEEESWFPA